MLLLASLALFVRGQQSLPRAHAAPAQPDPRPTSAGGQPGGGHLDMAALELGEAELAPATGEIPALRGSGELPVHEPGELPRWVEHRPLPRETIAQIAERYGVTREGIREWNELGPDEQPATRRPKPLRVRARRYPAPRVALRYEVVAGDIWAAVARRHGVNDRDLRAWNVSAVGRTLEPGESVEIWVEPAVYAWILADAPADARAASIRAGGHGVGTPQEGALAAGVQIPPGSAYWLRYPNSAYGTTYAVRETVAALDAFAQGSDYPNPISIGTMSRQRGGEVGSHHSHQSGRDLDIRLPLRPEVPQGLNPTKKRIDWDASYELVEAFAERGSVDIIFLDYQCQKRLRRAAEARGVDAEQLDELLQFPRGYGASVGLVRHSPGHEGHIHVRFACGPNEPLCSNKI